MGSGERSNDPIRTQAAFFHRLVDREGFLGQGPTGGEAVSPRLGRPRCASHCLNASASTIFPSRPLPPVRAWVLTLSYRFQTVEPQVLFQGGSFLSESSRKSSGKSLDWPG